MWRIVSSAVWEIASYEGLKIADGVGLFTEPISCLSAPQKLAEGGVPTVYLQPRYRRGKSLRHQSNPYFAEMIVGDVIEHEAAGEIGRAHV